MFDDNVVYGAAIRHVLGDGTPPNIHSDLRDGGTTVAQGSCSNCGGTLFDHNHEVICGNCSAVIGAETREQTPTRWEQFHANRPRYYHSHNKRCLGGFPDSYDWVERDDIDHPVTEIEPENFYR